MNQDLNKPGSLYKIYHAFWQLVDFVYPPTCCGCGNPGSLWCSDCQAKIQVISQNKCKICGSPLPSTGICTDCRNSPPPFTGLRSWAVYTGPLREALISLKYHNNLGLGLIFSKLLAEIVINENWNIDYIVPIPISKGHSRKRGYNQSMVIARPLSYLLDIPIENKAVIRCKETSSQVNLSRDERFTNLKYAFRTVSDTLLNKRVLIVDDITTTGATLISCSETLKDSGCSEVYCLTVAKTMTDHR